MDVLSSDSAILPDGTVVTISQQSKQWWVEQDATGYVHPKFVAPDPAQPRRHINVDRLAELHESIATRGVREPITITPLQKAPWVKIAPEYKGAFFAAVSGHRRWNGAMLAGLPAIPVRIKIYESAADHYLDASLLNSNREELTAIEEGWEIVRLRQCGWKLDDLKRFFGMALPQIYNRINLTQLHPDIQILLDPELSKKHRLPVTTAGILGGVKSPTVEELEETIDKLADALKGVSIRPEDPSTLDENERRFALQKILLAVIQVRSLNPIRATEFIRDLTLRFESRRGGVGPPTERYQPHRRREIVSNFVGVVNGSVLLDWPLSEFRRVYELASREEVEEVIAELKPALEGVAGILQQLERIRDNKKPTHPEALRIQRERAEEKGRTGSVK